jgi:hypothetical protein
VSKPSVATIAPAKRLRSAAKPASAIASNLDDAESPLHLLPRFVHIISQIEDEKLQTEARVALQEHDRQMDKAMQMVEDGKRLVSEGESAIKDAHQDAVAVLTRIFGGVSEVGSPARRRSTARSDRIILGAGSSGTTLEVLLLSFFPLYFSNS